MVQSPAALNTPALATPRTKYLPIELFCANMIPNTTYDAYMDGALVNAFCKPYGGTLGGALTSGPNGKLTFQLMIGIIYNQSFLVNPNGGGQVLINSSKSIVLIDPFNRASSFNLPINLQSGQA